MHHKQTMKQCITAMGIVLNVAGAFIAMNLKLPIYMDSIGTMMTAALLGPFYGGLAGLLGGIASGFTFDVYSFYYAIPQMTTGIMAGLLFKTFWMKGRYLPIGSFLATLPCTLLSAIVTGVCFGGLTSSGSSLIVILLDRLGVPMTASIFATQILTDYADKFLAVSLVTVLLAAMTYEMKVKVQGE